MVGIENKITRGENREHKHNQRGREKEKTETLKRILVSEKTPRKEKEGEWRSGIKLKERGERRRSGLWKTR